MLLLNNPLLHNAQCLGGFVLDVLSLAPQPLTTHRLSKDLRFAGLKSQISNLKISNLKFRISPFPPPAPSR